MTDLRKAAKMALEALEDSMYPQKKQFDAIIDLRQALAQPEQEPVALESIEQYRMQMAAISTAAIGYWKEGDNIHPDYDTLALRDVAKLYAKYSELYTAPPSKPEPVVEPANSATNFVESKHLAQPEQEPHQEHESRITALEIRVAKLENPITDHENQLMAGQRSLLRIAPPSKPWVSLTAEEISESAERMEAVDPEDSFWRDYARAIEAKLKELNHV